MHVSCIRAAAVAALLIKSAGTQAFIPPRSVNDAPFASASRLLPTTAKTTNSHYERRGRGGRLFIKSPWRTTGVEEEAKGASAAGKTNGETGPSRGLLQFFDDSTSSNDGGDQQNNQVTTTKNGPLDFLTGDMSPLAMDDEWAFSLDSDDVSAAQSQGGDGEDTGKDVAMMAGAGLVAASVIAGIALLGMGALDNFSLPSPADAVASVEHFFADPTATLRAVVEKVESMGSSGLLYFGVVYTVAEILAIPAIPLTASAGYLFGTVQGTSIVLLSASIAAGISFVIGRTLLRSYVEEVLEDYPKFKKIDNAIGREGFKLMVLLRLAPIFPFALSNYLYGATSVNFWPYFFGTLIGFTPGTIAYVSTGTIGKALTLDSASAYPWYAYAGGFALLTAFLKVAADVATGIIDELDEEDQ